MTFFSEEEKDVKFFKNQVKSQVVADFHKPEGKGWVEIEKSEYDSLLDNGYKEPAEDREFKKGKSTPAEKPQENVTPPAKEEAPELEFETVDTGDFEVCSLKEKGESFTGRFERFWKGEESEGSDPFDAIGFRRYPDNKKFALPDNLALKNFFEKMSDANGKAYDKENTVFKITRIDTKEIKGGKTVGIFDIKAAVLKS